jgi:solute carrier family 35 protein E3
LLDVVIYQELRILLTPATVIINFLAYRKTLAFRLVVALTVVCLGIGITIQSETLRTLKSGTGAAVDDVVKNTYLGYLAGLVGVALGAIYTVWLAVYLPKLQVTSMQLLYRQAPMACALLLVLAPFLDTMPVWSAITGPEWGLLALSGVSAVLINVSQFFIVAQSSAVSSTVVGHGKTIMIVAIGWMTAAKTISLQSGAGIIMALAGIVSYSYLSIMQK